MRSKRRKRRKQKEKKKPNPTTARPKTKRAKETERQEEDLSELCSQRAKVSAGPGDADKQDRQRSAFTQGPRAAQWVQRGEWALARSHRAP